MVPNSMGQIEGSFEKVKTPYKTQYANVALGKIKTL
jgi:hypothetical protein